MWNYLFPAPKATPLTQAYARRANPTSRVLIIGGGSICQHVSSETHKPHPSHAVTAALPKGSPGMWVDPQISADVTQTHAFCQAVPHDPPFDVVHFENVDSMVVASAGAMASVHACLAEGGTLIIETGGAGYPQTVQTLSGLLAILGFNVESCEAGLDGVIIVAKKKFSVGPRIHLVKS